MIQMTDIYEEVLSAVPDYTKFMTVDELDASALELADQYPDIVEVMTIGHSTDGSPILCLKIGAGSRNALAYGCPHPNEPMGAISMEYFAKALAGSQQLREVLDYTWYIIKCSDPDGTRLNEKWFGLPLTLYNFTRNVYRPAAYRQVEWTFPIHYKNHVFENPIPETKALMNLIEEIRPDFIYSLHNCMFGGAYWYLLNPLDEAAYNKLRDSARNRGIALRLGEPESPSCQMLSPSVYLFSGAKEQYDYYEAMGNVGEPGSFTHGTNAVDMAREIGTRNILVSELPLFYNQDAENENDSDMGRGASLQESYELNASCMEFVADSIERYAGSVSPENVFLLCLQERLDAWNDSAAYKKEFLKQQDKRAAKISEVFTNRYETLLFNMINIGLLIRMFEHEEADHNADPDSRLLKQGKRLAEAELSRLNERMESEITYNSIEIRHIIQVMIEDLFVVTGYLNRSEIE